VQWRSVLRPRNALTNGSRPRAQVAPIYKQLAEQYKNKAVFAKVDINANYQTASAQQIRSMPTFQLYLFGKKRDQFSGADVQRIQHMLQTLVSESEMKNIEVTFDALKAFYQEHAPEKMMEMDDKKLQDILDKAGKVQELCATTSLCPFPKSTQP
jgi:thioredoxin-like negative regulator of GroEL